MPACRKPPSEQGLAALGPAIRPAAFAEPTGSSGVGSSPSHATAPESYASRHHGSRRLPAMAESQHQSPLVLSLQERQSRRWCLQVREHTTCYGYDSARKSHVHGGFTARMMDDRHARERHIPTTLMEVHSAKHSALPVINATALWPRAASPLIGTRGSVCTESLPPMGRLCGDRCEGRLVPSARLCRTSLTSGNESSVQSTEAWRRRSRWRTALRLMRSLQERCSRRI